MGKNAQKKFIYIANIRLPTEKAHGLQIMKTCEALAEQGIEVELIVPARANYLKDNPFDFYQVQKNFKITKVWCLDFVSSNIFGKVGFWIESFTFYLSVRKVIRVHSAAVHYTRDLALAYWLSKKVETLFYEIHTLPDQLSGKYVSAWEQAQGLIVISDGLRNDLIKHGVLPEKIVVARDAVDLKQFQISENREQSRVRLRLQKDQKIVVYTGHLYEWKGAPLLAESVKILPPEIQVYFVGGTTKDVEKFRNKYSLPNLQIIGWQPHEMIPYWLKAADLLVIPNSAKEKISSIYTSPLKLFEYIVSGTPILASRLQSIQEILSEKHAVFFEPDHVEDLAEKILEFFSKAQSVKKIPFYDIERYSWEHRAQVIKEFVFSTFRN